MINLVLKSYKIKQRGMNLEKNSIKKINETKRNYNEKNGAQLFYFIKKNKVWNWKENQLEEGWKTK